ncbi:pyrroline-5-carboxylate reductase [Marinococcus halophilus]|uniref:pyrroline-5-carboxylate reductase n=1 Tax=Marinococcus halophilus TaxID=1371 RepID=UPI0009A6FA6F|nr:pyrroline-5-carboxylate reductase [Marinococcus halophilus]
MMTKTNLQQKTIAFIGSGSMAEAIFSGLLRHELVKPANVLGTVKTSADKQERLKKQYGIQVKTDNKEAVKAADVVVLAVKPKDAEAVIQSFAEELTKDKLVISVLAGISLNNLEAFAGKEVPVVRSMPNTSAHVGASTTAICAGSYATDEDLDLAESLFQVVGSVHTISEEDIDGFTAIAGSGPAYFYYFLEAMEQMAAEAGFPPEEAKNIIAHTIEGAAYRYLDSDKKPHELYQEVLSPNGVTEAAFTHLEKHRVQKHFLEAMKEASRRSGSIGD